MKNTITLKEFSALPPGVIQITYTSPVAYLDSQPQRTLESGSPMKGDPATEGFCELLNRRYTTPYRCNTPAARRGLMNKNLKGHHEYHA